MSKNIQDYEFRTNPKEITYLDGEPLKLDKTFSFFHNKIKFRKELTRLQLIFQDYTNISLLAPGIRDSYLTEEYSEKNLIVIFTTNKGIRNANQILDPYKDSTLGPGCFLLESKLNYMLLLAKDMEGLILGIDTMEDIFTQTFNQYFKQKNLDDYITIKPFKLISCTGE
ncbi:MAG: hypothetical protein EAX91_14830 [Candidatus Lokiarchaeota archaeon]|nr:hypothetical protein [Candidatus Lokiarchaeota archaeon]